MAIILPTSSEETHAKGTFLASNGQEVYCEVPADFIDGVLDEASTNSKINNFIVDFNKIFEPRTSGNTSGT